MSYTEFLKWQAYREQYGVLTMQKRLEHGLAMLFHFLFKGNVPIEDLLFFSAPKELTIEEAMQSWT